MTKGASDAEARLVRLPDVSELLAFRLRLATPAEPAIVIEINSD